MITDGLLNLVPPGSPLSLVGAANAGFPSLVIDQLGTGVGTAPQAIIGTRTLFGSDMGVDWIKPQITATIGVGVTTGSSGTLNMQFQGAPDTGAAGGYQPGTWTTYVETGPITPGITVANAVQLAANFRLRLDFADPIPFNNLPRFYRVNFQTVNSLTAGTIANCVITLGRDDYTAKFAAKNYAVA